MIISMIDGDMLYRAPYHTAIAMCVGHTEMHTSQSLHGITITHAKSESKKELTCANIQRHIFQKIVVQKVGFGKRTNDYLT